MNSFAFSVPMPPSSNMMFINSPNAKGRGRFMSPGYKAWRKDAIVTIGNAWRLSGSPKFDKHLSVTIHVGLNYQSDISNRIKAIEDVLPLAIPGFPDDRYIDRITIERVKGIDNARCLILQGAPL